MTAYCYYNIDLIKIPLSFYQFLKKYFQPNRKKIQLSNILDLLLLYLRLHQTQGLSFSDSPYVVPALQIFLPY